MNTSNDPLDAICDIGLETFAATEFDKIFSGRQPRQRVEVLRRFRDRILSRNCENVHTLMRLSAWEDVTAADGAQQTELDVEQNWHNFRVWFCEDAD